MSMYNHFVTAIKDKPADLDATLKRIDAYHIRGALTDEERDSLYSQARGAAQPNFDLGNEVARLWATIHDLTARVVALEGGAVEDGGNTEAVKEYVQPTGAHDAYYAGAVVSYNGTVYKCIAPDGAACVWAPDVMPDYWERVA